MVRNKENAYWDVDCPIYRAIHSRKRIFYFSSRYRLSDIFKETYHNVVVDIVFVYYRNYVKNFKYL